MHKIKKVRILTLNGSELSASGQGDGYLYFGSSSFPDVVTIGRGVRFHAVKQTHLVIYS